MNPSAEGGLVRMQGIRVQFGKVLALDGVDFHVANNEVVGLLGDNGAGKTTLIKCINGYHRISSGALYFDGRRTEFSSPAEARRMGIETAYQDLALVDLMSIARNFFLGRELEIRRGPFRFLDKRKMEEIASSLLSSLGLKCVRSMHESVSFLSGGERQAIAIGRASHFGAKLLILDEPTAALSVTESEWVLRLVAEAKKSGLAVILITHNAYEAFAAADRFVVLQHGKNYAEVDRHSTSAKDLIEMIAGRK